MKKILCATLLGCYLTQLTACGFALRGYETPVTAIAAPVSFILGNKQEDFAVKRALHNQFKQLNIPTADAPNPSTTTLPSIQVANIKLQNYQLRGILTEIRLVLSADVRYRIMENGSPKVITNNIQVQRSYQYNQASVSTDNPQAEQIKVWLYDNLAQRITDQYMALNSPQAKN